MAPKVVVPADFGIENLHCKFHGNVVLKLQGEDMRANSLIMSYHSSVFVHLFLELHQSVLEMEDFVGESVKSFLGALYSGEIQLERHLFRDVNKLCHVFKVDWLSGRCGDYFTGLVGGVSLSTDYQTLLFLFEEARFCMRVMKCDKFLDLVVQKICGLENRAEIFVEPYMKNYTELETSQLDLMIQITKNNPASLLRIMKQFVEKEGTVFDETSQYLLRNIDLCKCIYEDDSLYEDLLDTLENLAQLTLEDSAVIIKFYREANKEYKNHLQSTKSQSTAMKTSSVNKESNNISLASSSTPSAQEAQVLQSTQIRNVFTSLGRNLMIMGAKMEDFLTVAVVSERFLNLEMLLEGVFLFVFKYMSQDGKVGGSDVRRIEEIRIYRGWRRVSSEFFDSWSSECSGTASLIKRLSSDLISNDENFRRVGKVLEVNSNKIAKRNALSVKDLFNLPQSFAFYFKHPSRTKQCNVPGKCGFLLKTTPIHNIIYDYVLSPEPYKFRVELCLNQSEYPEDLHMHSHTAEKIHLLASCESEYLLGFLTWNENGHWDTFIGYDNDVTWRVGEINTFLPSGPGTSRIKLVAFISA